MLTEYETLVPSLVNMSFTEKRAPLLDITNTEVIVKDKSLPEEQISREKDKRDRNLCEVFSYNLKFWFQMLRSILFTVYSPS